MNYSKQDLHLAYVLHTRPYRETSLLVEVFSQQHGRVALVARGAKRGKAKSSSILQPFMPLNVSWFGSGELVTLMQVEVASISGHELHGKRAICGLYLNELLVKLLHHWDPCQALFSWYAMALEQLSDDSVPAQLVLRRFEVQLLKSLGYGLQLTIEVGTGAPVQPEQYYLFDPVLGPKLVSQAHLLAIKGASLLALANDMLCDTAVLAEIKRLMRMVLHYHLGTKQLLTRELL